MFPDINFGLEISGSVMLNRVIQVARHFKKMNKFIVQVLRFRFLFRWSKIVPKSCNNVVRCAIWYHLKNLKSVKHPWRSVILLVKLHAKTCNFDKSNAPPWVFFTFFKLYKSYQIAQCFSYWKIYFLFGSVL